MGDGWSGSRPAGRVQVGGAWLSGWAGDGMQCLSDGWVNGGREDSEGLDGQWVNVR